MNVLIAEVPPVYLKQQDGTREMKKFHKFLALNNDIQPGTCTILSQENVDELNNIGARIILIQSDVMIGALLTIPIPISVKKAENIPDIRQNYVPGPLSITNVYPKKKTFPFDKTKNINHWVGCTTNLCVDRDFRKTGAVKYLVKALEDFGADVKISDSYYVNPIDRAKENSIKLKFVKFLPSNYSSSDTILDLTLSSTDNLKTLGENNFFKYSLRLCNTREMDSHKGLEVFKDLTKNKKIRFMPDFSLWHKWVTSYEFYFVHSDKKKLGSSSYKSMFVLADINSVESDGAVSTTKIILMSAGDKTSLVNGIYKKCAMEKITITGLVCQDLDEEACQTVPSEISDEELVFDFYFSNLCKNVGRDDFCLPLF